MKITKENWKIILWGHKLHSHTHSYIHNAFYRAFEYMGFKTYWFDDNQTDLDNFDFSNTLFITEGQVDKKIPLRDDCFYILHNCYDPKYKELREKNKCTNLQVYTDAVLPYNLTKIDECIYADYDGKCFYMPWATDLLPHEIENNKPTEIHNKNHSTVYWVGTIGDGQFGNINEISPFVQACHENNIKFHQTMLVSVDENIRMIKDSYLAPTIVGTWQHSVGYVPCRIFKNISYGQFGLTNSPRVASIFGKQIIHNNNTKELFYDGKKMLETATLADLHAQMDFVKEKHTYINRINMLLEYIEKL